MQVEEEKEVKTWVYSGCLEPVLAKGVIYSISFLYSFRSFSYVSTKCAVESNIKQHRKTTQEEWFETFFLLLFSSSSSCTTLIESQALMFQENKTC